MREARDFRTESDTLAAVLSGASEQDFRRVTLFKNWTIEDVIGHLHVWNHAAALTLESREKFQQFFAFVLKHLSAGQSHPMMQRTWLDEFAGGLRGRDLFIAWQELYPRVAAAYETVDPQHRLAWAGPDMSAQSKIIARQMETWAHGQEIFDVLGLERKDSDAIYNIAHLGVTTYSWTFRNRSIDLPLPKPYVRLTSPSTSIWEWNDPQTDNRIEGDATQFCQVVTQTRNVGDTNLAVAGENALRWMSLAQCFAGAPNDPPAKGTRRRNDG